MEPNLRAGDWGWVQGRVRVRIGVMVIVWGGARAGLGLGVVAAVRVVQFFWASSFCEIDLSRLLAYLFPRSLSLSLSLIVLESRPINSSLLLARSLTPFSPSLSHFVGRFNRE